MTLLVRDCGYESHKIASTLQDVRGWLLENVGPILDESVDIFEPPNHVYEQSHQNNLILEYPYSPVVAEALEKIPSIMDAEFHILSMVEILHGSNWLLCVTRHKYVERDYNRNRYTFYMIVPDDSIAVMVKLKFF